MSLVYPVIKSVFQSQHLHFVSIYSGLNELDDKDKAIILLQDEAYIQARTQGEGGGGGGPRAHFFFFWSRKFCLPLFCLVRGEVNYLGSPFLHTKKLLHFFYFFIFYYKQN